MSILDVFDPTGNNFLGMGKYMGRGLGDLATMGTGEWFRPDPYGMGHNTIGGQVGHGIGGAMQGAAGGFVTGGIPGAVMGGATGGVRSGLGDSQPWTLAGHGGGALGNFGIGAGEGALYSGAHALMTPSGAPSGASSQPSVASQMLQASRAMPMGGGQQAPAASQADILQRLYQLFPSLRPGAQIGQGMNMGGRYGA